MRGPRGPFLAAAVAVFFWFVAAPEQGTAQTRTATQRRPPAAGHNNAAAPAAQPGAKLTEKRIQRVNVTDDYKQQFESAMRVAVLVAPKYSGSGLAPLSFTLADVTELSMELERQHYKVRVIKNNEAFAENVRKALQEQAQVFEGSQDGTLLFAFTGHGFQIPNGGNYLITTGVNASPENIKREALALEEVEQLMKASGARRRVIFIDACRSDPGARSAGVEGSFAKFQAAEGTAILLSTNPGGTSYEDPELGHGIFTHYVLEGLRGKAASKDGYVTFIDLSRYVQDQVLSFAMKKDKMQKPFSMGEQSGDFLLATAPRLKDEEKPKLEGLKEVSNEAPVMRALEMNRSFFLVRRDDVLTLYDSSTFQPYAVLRRAQSAEGLQRYEGAGPQNKLMHLVLEMNGEEIKAASGRIGTPCPGDQPCGADTLANVALPGEAKSTNVRAKAKDCGGMAHTVGNVLGGIRGAGRGNRNKTADKVGGGCDETGKSTVAFNPLEKYRWQRLTLTGSLPGTVARAR